MKDQAGALRALVEERRVRELKPESASGRLQSAKTSPCRMIAVTSGKGGVGKSNITLNLGLHWAIQGKRVLMVDADMGMANADLLLGWTGRAHLGEFLAGIKSLPQIIQHHPKGLDVIVGLSGSRLIPSVLEAHLQQCLKELQRLVDDYDIILFDTGAGGGRIVTDFLGAANEILLVTSPEPTAMMDAYSLMKLAATKGGGQKWYLLVNMAINDEEALSTAKSLTKAAGKFLNQDIQFLGSLPKDQDIPLAVRKQHPWLLSYPHSSASRKLPEIARALEGQTNAQRHDHKRTLSHWLKLIRARTLKGD